MTLRRLNTSKMWNKAIESLCASGGIVSPAILVAQCRVPWLPMNAEHTVNYTNILAQLRANSGPNTLGSLGN